MNEIEFAPDVPNLKYELFGKLFHWVVDSGINMKLSGNAAKVLIVLLRYADFNCGMITLKNETISKKSGIYIYEVSKAIRNLIDLGIIESHRKGRVRIMKINSKHKHSNRYTYKEIYKADSGKTTRMNSGKTTRQEYAKAL